MADVFSKDKRSEIMARVRGSGNKATELALISAFRLHGLTGWRRHAKVFGKPDFVFPQERVAVFVDGCFWHGCPKHGTAPVSNAEFWNKKLARNKSRDRLVTQTLRAREWNVIRIWQHALSRDRQARTIERIQRALDEARNSTFDR